MKNRKKIRKRAIGGKRSQVRSFTGTREAERLRTPEQVGKILQITVKSVHRLCREGKLSYVQINGRREKRFTKEQILELIKTQTNNGPKPLDKKSLVVLPYPKEGGDQKRKSVGVNGSGSLLKEIRELCQYKR